MAAERDNGKPARREMRARGTPQRGSSPTLRWASRSSGGAAARARHERTSKMVGLFPAKARSRTARAFEGATPAFGRSSDLQALRLRHSFARLVARPLGWDRLLVLNRASTRRRFPVASPRPVRSFGFRSCSPLRDSPGLSPGSLFTLPTPNCEGRDRLQQRVYTTRRGWRKSNWARRCVASAR
jgi:hypothetical protein